MAYSHLVRQDAYVWDKNTSPKLCTKKAGGGLMREGGGIFAGHYSIIEKQEREKKNSFYVISSVTHTKIEA